MFVSNTSKQNVVYKNNGYGFCWHMPRLTCAGHVQKGLPKKE